MADPDPLSLAAILTSLLTAAGAAYVALRKQRKAESSADHEQDAGDRDVAIRELRANARVREQRHAADITRLERLLAEQSAEIVGIRRQERECQMLAARQDSEIRFLREELQELKDELKAKGVTDRTDQHKPLPPDPR